MYSEKKSSANKCLCHHPNTARLEARIYGNTSILDAKNHVRGKRNNRNIQCYIETNIESQDLLLSRISLPSLLQEQGRSEVKKCKIFSAAVSYLRSLEYCA